MSYPHVQRSLDVFGIYILLSVLSLSIFADDCEYLLIMYVLLSLLVVHSPFFAGEYLTSSVLV